MLHLWLLGLTGICVLVRVKWHMDRCGQKIRPKQATVHVHKDERRRSAVSADMVIVTHHAWGSVNSRIISFPCAWACFWIMYMVGTLHCLQWKLPYGNIIKTQNSRWIHTTRVMHLLKATRMSTLMRVVILFLSVLPARSSELMKCYLLVGLPT